MDLDIASRVITCVFWPALLVARLKRELRPSTFKLNPLSSNLLRIHYSTPGSPESPQQDCAREMGRGMADGDINISEAIALYLRNYPGNNDAEFDPLHGQGDALAAKEAVRTILKQAIKLVLDWNSASLRAAGQYVESVMRDRHFDLFRRAPNASATATPI